MIFSWKLTFDHRVYISEDRRFFFQREYIFCLSMSTVKLHVVSILNVQYNNQTEFDRLLATNIFSPHNLKHYHKVLQIQMKFLQWDSFFFLFEERALYCVLENYIPVHVRRIYFYTKMIVKWSPSRHTMLETAAVLQVIQVMVIGIVLVLVMSQRFSQLKISTTRSS